MNKYDDNTVHLDMNIDEARFLSFFEFTISDMISNNQKTSVAYN